jgi:hypothetical protein
MLREGILELVDAVPIPDELIPVAGFETPDEEGRGDDIREYE